ncbi:FAD-dependent monooxygenase [Variovorax terrae]|uniref:FAD-dependent monooxygenase n=1 Tax=Variovorax terrae TaxID=2923278 RepID=A0A9X1VY07_9BURK|nr:FAD-dependent monooxygenase [Variovorax terrae]MCJ0764234.1 FAD-dependent monooxygenase [Variovorax terrae]
MQKQFLVAGGGIGGLAAALACTRAGWQGRLFEQAEAFSEVGAGLQLGPNATRLLQAWGLDGALAQVAAFPDQLRVRSALDGRELGRLRLGETIRARYGAPYATVHRADLHALLLAAAGSVVSLNPGTRIAGVNASEHAVVLRTAANKEVEGEALIGADGLWSTVRRVVWGDGPAQPTGHLAYRALVSQQALPAALRSTQVTAWLGPQLHVVAYPVRQGDALNVVAIVERRPGGEAAAAAESWDQAGTAAELLAALGEMCAPLRELVQAMPGWRLWALNDRPPLQRPEQMVRGRVVLLGDAAHPMRPYLAQGAGMALEDAFELAHLLAMEALDVPTALRRYGLNRWQRCARVQARSQRNGRIFHAAGPLAWGRDLAMRALGERLLDLPWLYRGAPWSG